MTAPGAPVTPAPGAPGWRDWYLNYGDQNAAFMQYLSNMGGIFNNVGTRQGQFARGLLPEFQNRYSQSLASNPSLGFFDYLNQTASNIPSLYANLPASQRGLDTSRSQPRTMWRW